MKLYADYLKEREGIDCKYNDYMFATYKIYEDNTATILDIYVDPQVRKKGIMLDFIVGVLEDIKKQGIKTIYTTTVTSTNGWERSDYLIQKYGFTFCGVDPNNENIRNYYLDIEE